MLTLFTQPSVPDVRGHLLKQDVIWVEGGSVVNLMAVWRAHGLPQILRECWQAGVVLTGSSAGSLCWHLGGPTDSFSDSLAPFTDGLGLVPFSNGVHDDLDDQPRRGHVPGLIAQGKLPAGYATEDGVGLLYAGQELLEAVTILPGRHAWHVTPGGNGGYAEQAIVPRLVPRRWPRLSDNDAYEHARAQQQKGDQPQGFDRHPDAICRLAEHATAACPAGEPGPDRDQGRQDDDVGWDCGAFARAAEPGARCGYRSPLAASAAGGTMPPAGSPGAARCRAAGRAGARSRGTTASNDGTASTGRQAPSGTRPIICPDSSAPAEEPAL